LEHDIGQDEALSDKCAGCSERCGTVETILMVVGNVVVFAKLFAKSKAVSVEQTVFCFANDAQCNGISPF